MKILHILSQKPDFTGSGKYVQEMILQGRAKGHELFLMAGASADFELPTVLQPCQCQLVRFDGLDIGFPIMGMSDVMPYPSSICSALTPAQINEYKAVFAENIARAVADFAPDIIHSNHLWMVTALAREVAPDIPLVCTCHGSCLRQHRLCPGLGQSLLGQLRGIDQIIALFEQQKQEITALLGIEASRVHVVSGGYNELCFYTEESDKKSATVNLVYAGKLDSSKGVPWLLRSLKQVQGPWRLHLVGAGSGSQRELCLQLASELGDKVIVHGILTHQELGALMRCCDIFVLPSFFEGLPLVLLEALACGCAIVTTNLPGAQELFGPHPPPMVRLVELPPLETVDKPYAADEPMLEQRLASALRASIHDVRSGESVNKEYVCTLTNEYGWKSIFSRIEAVYNLALKSRQANKIL